MNFGTYLQLASATPTGVSSWVFLLSMAIKVGSTAVGLKIKAPAGAKTEVPSILWWLSKLSALLLCLTAALLCNFAGDESSEVAFLALFALALFVVAGLTFKRHSQTATIHKYESRN